MAFKSWPGLITAGNPATTIYTCPANAEGSVHGLVLSAAAAGTATPVLTLHKQSLGSGLVLPCDPVTYGTAYSFLKPINMEAGDYLTISVTSVDLHVLASIYEDGAVASAGTFNPRGAYSAPATYNKLDVVESAGVAWICMTDGVTGDAPPSVNWMQAVVAPTGALLANNNLGDVSDPVAALAAIGGATAAQGAKADAAMPLAGGVFTGTVKTLGVEETSVALSVAAPDMDLSAGSVFTLTTAGAVNLTQSNAPAGAWVRTLLITAGGADAVSFPAGWDWGEDGVPDALAMAGDILEITFRAEGAGTVRASQSWRKTV